MIHEHNPTQHFAILAIGKKQYRLTFDLAAIATAEKLTGQSLLFGVNWTALDVSKLIPMLYAAMLREQPEITLEEVKKLVKPRHSMAITAAMFQAWFENEGEADEESENPPTPEA